MKPHTVISKRFAPYLMIFVATTALAQDAAQIELQVIPAAKNVYMISGAGGNIALLAGEDGALIVDTGVPIPGLAEKIAAAVKKECDKPIRLVIDTHWHFDHVGGNEAFHEGGALIASHENVRMRMSTEQYLAHIERKAEPSPAGALPAITCDDEMSLHWNGDEIRIIHVPNAHTDGDSFVYFTKANVLHVGDTCFSGMYPYIDINAGGSIDGMIAAADRTLALANEQTRIIPGHGPLSTVEEVRAFRKMLTTSKERVQALIDAGKTRDEAIAAKPMSDLDEQWGKKAFKPDEWIAIVYDSLTKK